MKERYKSALPAGFNIQGRIYNISGPQHRHHPSIQRNWNDSYRAFGLQNISSIIWIAAIYPDPWLGNLGQHNTGQKFHPPDTHQRQSDSLPKRPLSMGSASPVSKPDNGFIIHIIDISILGIYRVMALFLFLRADESPGRRTALPQDAGTGVCPIPAGGSDDDSRRVVDLPTVSPEVVFTPGS